MEIFAIGNKFSPTACVTSTTSGLPRKFDVALISAPSIVKVITVRISFLTNIRTLTVVCPFVNPPPKEFVINSLWSVNLALIAG